MASISECLRLAEYTSARLCHELSGLAGSLTGALELLAEEQPSTGETLPFARQAASDLVQRLRLLRAAWGPDIGPLTLAEIMALSRGLSGARRVVIDPGAIPPGTVFPSPASRLLLNLLMLAAEGLPGGGTVGLAGGPADLFVMIAGPRAGWPSGLAACLADPAEAFAALTDTRALQMPLTALLARGHDVRLSLLMGVGNGIPGLRMGGA